MPGLTLNVPLQVLPPTPPPKPLNEGRYHLVAVPVPQDSISRATSATSSGKNASSSQDEDPELEQHTLSSYGDLSFSDGFILSSDDPDPPQPAVEAIQPKFPYARPRFRLKVRRPPMPKRRLSYAHAGAPLSGAVDRKTEDGNWPGSPRNSLRHQHPPLVFPLHEHSCPKTSGSAVVVNSVASKAPDQKCTSGKGERDNLPQTLPGPPVAPVAEQPSPPQEKSNSEAKGWRTRLPPRPPLPKWDA